MIPLREFFIDITAKPSVKMLLYYSWFYCKCFACFKLPNFQPAWCFIKQFVFNVKDSNRKLRFRKLKIWPLDYLGTCNNLPWPCRITLTQISVNDSTINNQYPNVWFGKNILQLSSSIGQNNLIHIYILL